MVCPTIYCQLCLSVNSLNNFLDIILHSCNDACFLFCISFFKLFFVICTQYLLLYVLSLATLSLHLSNVLNVLFFFLARSQNCEKRQLASSCVCLSAWINSAPTWRIITKFYNWVFFKSVQKNSSLIKIWQE